MKRIIPLYILSILLCTSCKKVGCTDSTATNYDQEAEKNDGSCIPEPRTPYLGTYTVTDSMYFFGSFDNETIYSLNVTTGGTVSDTLLLVNLWGDGDSYFCLLIDESITIYSQQVNGPYYTSGSGSLSNGMVSYSTSGDTFENYGVGTKD